MMARGQQLRCHVAIGFWLLCGGLAVAQVDDGQLARGPRTVYVVREYLLESMVPSRVKGYTPMRRDNFEDKLKALMRTATDDVAGEAKLISGVFYAKYQDGQLVDGRAGLEVVNKQQASSVLSFGTCRLPIRQLRWSDSDASNVMAGGGIAGNYVVIADLSSRLIFSWSLRGDDSRAVPGSPPLVANAGTRFVISLPPSSINHLVIDLPTGLVPVVDVGDARLVGSGYEDVAIIPETVEAGFDRWLMALGGTREFTLRVLDRAAAGESNAFTRVRQATSYRLSTSAIEVQAEISLTFSQSELHRLVLKTDPDLRVASVRIGERELLPDQITRGEQPGHVVLTFDTPLQGSGRTLIVDALSPLVMDEPVRLPALHPLDLDWEQATAMLEVPDTLVLKKLVCSNALETSVELRSGMAGGEVHHFQLYNQDATCEFVVGRPSMQTVVASGAAIAVSPTTLTAQVVADVHSVHGDVFLLDALINAPWTVDFVESTPTDALDGTPARRTRGRRIRMQLRQPVSGDQKVRILINARRSVPAVGTDLTAKDFRIVEFRNVATHRRFVSLRAEAPYHLMVDEKQQTTVDPAELIETERELLGTLTSGLVYLDDGQDDSFRVSLTQEKPQFSARISVEAMADSDVLRQAIRIRCQPESSPISSLLVRLFPSPDIPFTWSTDEPDGVHSARLIKTLGSQDSATWEVLLRQQRTTPFHLTAVCSSPLIDTTPVYLATLVEAVDQSGSVAVGAVDGTNMSVEVNGLTAVPVVKPQENEYTYQRAAYRYDPTRDHTVTVSRQPSPREPALAWAWACELVSRFETNGVTSHRVQFKIQNSGRPQTNITLPATATVHRVSVDETEVSYAKSSGDTLRITIQLPPKKRFPSVRVDYSTSGEPLRGFTSRKTRWPQINMPCLNRTWDIWLPPGMHAREDARFVKTTVMISPNWEDRLFGSANLRSEKRPFDLFSLPDWQTIGQTASRDAAMTAASFVAALENVVVVTDTSNETLTWGQIVSRYNQLRSKEPSSHRLRSLRIDANALRDQNVTAAALVSTETRQSVSKLLGQHNLAVVASPDTILLTSVSRLGDFDGELRDTRDHNVFITRRDGSSFAVGPESAVSSNAWSNETAHEPAPWLRAAREDGQEFGVGRRHYRLRPADTPEVQFFVYRPAVFRVTGWGVSFVMIAVVVWFSKRHVKSLALIVVATILTLLIPIQFVPVARGLMWGGLAGLLLTFLRDRAISAPPRAAIPRGSVTLAKVTVILLLALGAWQAFADDDVNIPLPNALQIYRVVIPVDEKDEPVGEFVFVPNPLFSSLHRPAAARTASLTWLLRSAAYETSLALRGDADGLVEAEVSADYELETFQMGMTVAFPLGRDGVRRLTNVKLDGQVIDPAWNATGEALEILITRPGRHRLEIALRPVLRNDTESSGFALRVPEFAGAQLKVSPSTRIEGIELPSAIGAIDRSESLGTIEADMGPTNLLAVRWPLSSKTVEEVIPLTVVERFWLRIQPSSVVLEGQFAFTVPRGGIEQVRLLVDPRLKLSQLIASPPAHNELESGPIPSIVIRFDESSENQVFVHATFLMTDTSGLGNVYLPRLSAVADAKGISTLGLSVATELAVALVADPPLQAIRPAEFLADWIEPTDPPQLAYRLDEPNSRWHMTSRPRAAPSVTQQLSSWSIGWTRARLHYSADVDPTGQECFQQRLRVPQSLEIHNLEIFRGEEPQAVRWTRANAVLTAFFAEAIKDRYRLVIDGEAPTAFRQRTMLPLVSMQGVEFQSNRIVVRQRSDVLIQELEASGLVKDADDVTESILADHENGRLFKSFILPSVTEDQTETTLSFLTKRNRPQITGRIVNHVSFGEDDVWFADVEMTLNLKSGVVDELRMALPVGWSEPLAITPEINHEIVDMDSDRVLVLRPRKSISKQFRLHIRCQSQRATAALSEVPLVKILNESQVQQYLVLPGSRGEEVITWATSGLQPIPNLPNPNSPLPDVDSTSYRVEGTRVTAVIHNVGRLGGTPQVQLADISIAWNHDRTWYGVAAFDVMPLQTNECILVVPPDLKIAHVNVAGVPVTWRTESKNRLAIPLGPEQLPQRIDVVFFGRRGSTSAIPGEMISAPSLADPPVEQTLWTIHGPVGAHLDKALLEHSLTNAVQQARIRASSATLFLEMADMLTPPVPEVGFESWRQTWERRRDLATTIVNGSGDPEVNAETDILALAARNFRETENGLGQPVRFAMRGPSSSVHIQFSHDEASDLGQRAGISVAIACLGLLFGFLRRQFRLREWIEQSWHALGVGFGVVWWLWFTPSFVGLVVMGLFLAAALWPIRKSHRVLRVRD